MTLDPAYHREPPHTRPNNFGEHCSCTSESLFYHNCLASRLQISFELSLRGVQLLEDMVGSLAKVKDLTTNLSAKHDPQNHRHRDEVQNTCNCISI